MSTAEPARPLTRRLFLARSAATVALATGGPTVLPAWAHASRAPSAATAAVGPVDVVDVEVPDVTDPTLLTVAQAATLIRRGRLDAETLVRAHLRRIDRFEPVYQAFNTVRREEALAAARRRDRARPRTALHGIPVAVKDNYFTAGVPTTVNSYLFADFVPPYSATAVTRMLRAGAVLVGKTQMGPLATTRATRPNGEITTVNAWAPHDPDVDPGGSSTGSATAVAGRLASIAVGTQTGGSITSPSNAQGLTGLKPTLGRVSLRGIVPLTFTRDHPGPLAKDVLDAAILLTEMAGEDPRDPRTQGLPPLPDLVRAARPVSRQGRVVARRRVRVGIPPDWAPSDDPSVAAARRRLLDTLAGIPRVQVVDVDLPDEWELLTGSAFNDVRLPERTEAFREFLRRDLRGFGVSVVPWLMGLLMSGDEFLTGQRAKTLLLERVLAGMLEQADVVLQSSPIPFDILGLPELAFPIGFSGDADSARPIGTILGGGPYEEDRLVEVVAAYQAVTDWHRRHPADPNAVAPSSSRRQRLSATEVAALSE